MGTNHRGICTAVAIAFAFGVSGASVGAEDQSEQITRLIGEVRLLKAQIKSLQKRLAAVEDQQAKGSRAALVTPRDSAPIAKAPSRAKPAAGGSFVRLVQAMPAKYLPTEGDTGWPALKHILASKYVGQEWAGQKITQAGTIVRAQPLGTRFAITINAGPIEVGGVLFDRVEVIGSVPLDDRALAIKPGQRFMLKGTSNSPEIGASERKDGSFQFFAAIRLADK